MLTEDRALRVALDCCRALEYLHGRQIIHRDIKPRNVLFDEDGVAKLSDFVLARQAVLGLHLTAQGIAVGDPMYMSPEQVKAQNIDARADLYCLGCMMFHMLTGRLPFEGSTPIESMQKRLTEELPSVEEFRDGVSLTTRRIVRRLSLRDPDQRYASAAEARAAVEAALSGAK